uniref:Uncharacterized protein n=1 Tax=Manihot esculenta TaxID=3983 RepID=A0A2C9VH76_MANES
MEKQDLRAGRRLLRRGLLLVFKTLFFPVMATSSLLWLIWFILFESSNKISLMATSSLLWLI